MALANTGSLRGEFSVTSSILCVTTTEYVRLQQREEPHSEEVVDVQLLRVFDAVLFFEATSFLAWLPLLLVDWDILQVATRRLELVSRREHSETLNTIGRLMIHPFFFAIFESPKEHVSLKKTSVQWLGHGRRIERSLK